MAEKRSASKRKPGGFTEEERAAMKERSRELKAARRGKGDVDGESEVLAKIAELPEQDRATAERLHAIVKAVAPELSPRTWYGMPAYAKDGKVLCFFQSGEKFKTRYATLGFSDEAKRRRRRQWPNSYALTQLTAAEAKRIVELLRRAIG